MVICKDGAEYDHWIQFIARVDRHKFRLVLNEQDLHKEKTTEVVRLNGWGIQEELYGQAVQMGICHHGLRRLK